MKNGKLPTRSQKILMKSKGLDPSRYLVVKNTTEYVEVVSRIALKKLQSGLATKARTRKLYKEMD